MKRTQLHELLVDLGLLQIVDVDEVRRLICGSLLNLIYMLGVVQIVKSPLSPLPKCLHYVIASTRVCVSRILLLFTHAIAVQHCSIRGDCVCI